MLPEVFDLAFPCAGTSLIVWISSPTATSHIITLSLLGEDKVLVCYTLALVLTVVSYFKIYKTIILPVVLYGCETWSLTLREAFRLRVLENRILRRIFGPKNGEWRRIHNEELHSLYRSPNVVRVIKSRRLKWAGHVARMEESRSSFKILTGKPTGKRHL